MLFLFALYTLLVFYVLFESKMYLYTIGIQYNTKHNFLDI